MPVRDALARHYLTHGLPPDGGASDPWFRVRIGPVVLPLPNPPARRCAVVLHDINHIVTGYDTTFSEGEVAIAAFEVGAGCGRFGTVWFINLTMLAIGVLFHPHRVFAAYLRGRRSASIYRCAQGAAALSAMSVADVRALLRVDDAPLPVRFAERVQFAMWAVVGVLALLVPFTATIAFIGTAFQVLGR